MTGTSFESKTELSGKRSGEIGSRATHPYGFTMIELLIALAIAVILTAIAVPRVINAVALTRIRSAANDVSGLIQQARATAEQRNATVPFYATNVGQSNLPGVFISCSSANGGACPDGANWAATDPYLPYSGNVANAPAANAPAVVPQASLGFTTQPAGTILYFTPLGMVSNAPAGTFTAKGFVFYLRDTRNNWAAVSVSPTGRSKIWMYTGNSWH